MPDPLGTTVTISASPQRTGTRTRTGRLHVAAVLPAGQAVDPVTVASAAAARAAFTGAGASVGEQLAAAFSTGLAEATVVRLEGAVTTATAVQADWATAFGKLPAGPANVIALGATTPAAHAALLAHSASTGKAVFLDIGDLADIAAADAAADLLSGTVGDTRSGIFGNSTAVPQPTGTVTIPASLAVAAIAARGDARRGHAQHAPVWDQAQRPGAGEVQGAVSVARTLSDNDLALLAAARINPLRVRNGVVELASFFSLDDDARWSQLNHGRGAMDLADRVNIAGQQFVGQPLDPVALQAAETAVGGILDDLVERRAILDDFVVVASADYPARNLHVAVECTFVGATERVLITVTVDTSGEVAAA